VKQLAMDVGYEQEPAVFLPGWVLYDDVRISAELRRQLTDWTNMWTQNYFHNAHHEWPTDGMREVWIERGLALAAELNRELLATGFVVWPAFVGSGFRIPTLDEFSSDEISDESAHEIVSFLNDHLKQHSRTKLAYPPQ
jgi:hypothetical protein